MTDERANDPNNSNSDNLLESQLYRKKAFNQENYLLPKSLLKDLIEDESSSESINESPIGENFKEFDFSKETLENQITNAYTNFGVEQQEVKNRSSTYNDNEYAMKNLKIAETFNLNNQNNINNYANNPNQKIQKNQSHNDFTNFGRPKINNLNTINTINTLNASNMNNNNNNMNNTFFNADTRTFSEDQQNNFMANINNISNINTMTNMNMVPNKKTSFSSLARASSVSQNAYGNNINNINNIQHNSNLNMRFPTMPGRSNFPLQGNPNTNFNNSGCINMNNNNNNINFCNNSFAGMSPNNINNCNMAGKNNINQMCLCPNCIDESNYINENPMFYQNMGNPVNMRNCQNSNLNNNNNMNFNQQQFEVNNMNQCRTYCGHNHPNLGLGLGKFAFKFKYKKLIV